MSETLKKSDIEGLTALQVRMALILLTINGVESAKAFIRDLQKPKEAGTVMRLQTRPGFVEGT